MVILLGVAGDEPVQTEGQNTIIPPVKVTRAERGTLDKTLRLNGYIESNNIITVIPFVSGTLNSVTVELGEHVEENQLIAVIDSRAYDLQLKQAEAAYFGAKSSFERIEQLYNSNAATRQNYDQVKTQYEAYKSQYELAELQVSYTQIKAPIEGTVLMIHANQGSITAPELPLLTIGSLDDLVVKLKIPDKYYELFRTSEDMPVRIFRPGLEESAVEAYISNVSPIISPQTRNFEVVCEIEGAAASFRPGMFVYSLFNIESAEEVYYLPYKALGPSSTLWYIDEDNSTAEKIDFVRTFSNNEYFAIPDDYSDYTFITEGQSFLTPGQIVRVK